MSPAARRLLSAGMLASLRRRMFVPPAARPVGVNSGRSLALSAQDKAKDKVSDEPIKFSTSKASHRTWRVERSLGSQFQRPWWKVLPVSLFFIGVMLWCALREETDIDVLLGKQLHEHLPGLLPETEDQPDSLPEDEAQTK
ncbi:ubiquinol-cytochrome-c reductase complex assembly factor 4 isoform X2 [Pseudoliparis swirei]|uniref:ubiquinol-cytochrome-c reductase complex assembly factor 4 isoform X2 n=1 Tax=Pseudoliparis swirei TaxID=2059687 RepID=UPI0024BE2A6B|nr:ubiquinol-cytochrome-c reductase complex assembly factor 4 isoform X2 [Pseudoliparis swirei]